ncbi:lysylphosphatidylglycerol synthase domain-containing protein, partial [Desulfococcus sp.]|uniref:lysylphosphatidylglycerol synthase domain-containing protein n=1 Tax=Desulfococcus sp. TaxID=2025834 RepID=UPI00359394AE
MRRSILRLFLWYVVVLAVLGIGASAAGVLRPERVAAAMARIRVPGLLWLAAINGVILLAATGRWWRILSAFGHRIAPVRLTAYRIAAGAVSYVTPGSQFGGEPLQAFLLVRREGVPADIAAAAVFLERAMELALNLILVGGGLLWMVRRPLPGVEWGLPFNALGRGGAGRVLTAVCFGAAAV